MHEEEKFVCCKIILFENDIKTLKFKYFPRVRTNAYKTEKLIEDLYLDSLITCMGNIKTKFENRFQPINKWSNVFVHN
jgi:hypothetical protein